MGPAGVFLLPENIVGGLRSLRDGAGLTFEGVLPIIIKGDFGSLNK